MWNSDCRFSYPLGPLKFYSSADASLCKLPFECRMGVKKIFSIFLGWPIWEVFAVPPARLLELYELILVWWCVVCEPARALPVSRPSTLCTTRPLWWRKFLTTRQWSLLVTEYCALRLCDFLESFSFGAPIGFCYDPRMLLAKDHYLCFSICDLLSRVREFIQPRGIFVRNTDFLLILWLIPWPFVRWWQLNRVHTDGLAGSRTCGMPVSFIFSRSVVQQSVNTEIPPNLSFCRHCCRHVENHLYWGSAAKVVSLSQYVRSLMSSGVPSDEIAEDLEAVLNCMMLTGQWPISNLHPGVVKPVVL